ncbi:hypothetical protein N7490_003116 [Penicillium lividum]|nr:hypothetical protein N7490_003116 [Penicillium lividum]
MTNPKRLAPLTADTLDPETFNPLIPRVTQQAIARTPIWLPWQARVLPLGMFFRSGATAELDGSEYPFASESAFDVESLSSASVRFTTDDDSGRFRSSEAMSSSASMDHLSVSVGAGVDLGFLEASVSVNYDRNVLQNRDSNKASVTTSYRAGTVAFSRPPELSEDAFRILQKEGMEVFKAEFGDYYVGGYRIGGDTSVLFTTDASRRSEVETKRVSISVDSLFGDYHEEDATSLSSSEENFEVHISAYSTLEQLLIMETVQAGTPRFQTVLEQGRGIHRRSQDLRNCVALVLQELGVRSGKRVTPQQCSRLCEHALVVELVLMPVETLRQVRAWSILQGL